MSVSKRKKSESLLLRASSWRTWQKCALSLKLKDESPFREKDTKEDEYAAEGTRIHAAIEADLKGQSREKFDVETEAIVSFAVNAAKTEASSDKLESEVFASVLKRGVTIAGTADAVIHRDDELVIIDFKTGYKEISAESNEQLKIYAHLLQRQGQKTWRGIIVNARLNSLSYTGPHEFEKRYLSGIITDVLQRLKSKQHVVGSHCAYCSALAVCQLFRVELTKWLIPGIEDGIKNRKEDWVRLLALIKPAEKLFERVKADALKYIELGGELPGVSVEFSGGTRAWPTGLPAAEIATQLGVDESALYDKKIISPAELERRGVPREKINAVAVQPMRRTLKVK
jgi:CRISPR/Cas system-associated exonuclease Cas4 (RecB family)